MGQMINVNIRMDEELKKQADLLFNELGLNMSTAVNMFVRQAVRTGGIPFEVTVRGGQAGNFSGPWSFSGNPNPAQKTAGPEQNQGGSSALDQAENMPGQLKDGCAGDCDPAEP